MQRIYKPYPEKHKEPKGFGSLCPSDMPVDLPPKLLSQAVAVGGVGQGKLWAAAGEWCFCAHSSRPGEWHGFPVIGGEVDERVLNELERLGQISTKEKRQLRRQRSLPDSWHE